MVSGWEAWGLFCAGGHGVVMDMRENVLSEPGPDASDVVRTGGWWVVTGGEHALGGTCAVIVTPERESWGVLRRWVFAMNVRKPLFGVVGALLVLLVLSCVSASGSVHGLLWAVRWVLCGLLGLGVAGLWWCEKFGGAQPFSVLVLPVVDPEGFRVELGGLQVDAGVSGGDRFRELVVERAEQLVAGGTLDPEVVRRSLLSAAREGVRVASRNS